ncbi:VanZ family protein [Bergeyella porcorum]|uniref:VanZ family protein n=1 Tax=Bergeyella porcorum TaxID=1735111 RepID=UPI0035E966F1
MQTNQSFYLQRNTKQLLDKIAHISKFVLPIYWAILTYILLRPGIETEGIRLFPHADKVVHFAAFFILGFLLKATFPKIRFSIYAILIISYGLLTEVLQGVMQWGRTLEFLDLVADTLGGFLALYLYSVTKSRL